MVGGGAAVVEALEELGWPGGGRGGGGGAGRTCGGSGVGHWWRGDRERERDAGKGNCDGMEGNKEARDWRGRRRWKRETRGRGIRGVGVHAMEHMEGRERERERDSVVLSRIFGGVLGFAFLLCFGLLGEYSRIALVDICMFVMLTVQHNQAYICLLHQNFGSKWIKYQHIKWQYLKLLIIYYDIQIINL